MLISNGWTDDLFPPDESLRFYNRTRTNHPGTPISLIFTDHGHQRGQNKAPDLAFEKQARHVWLDFYVKGVGAQPYRRPDPDEDLRRALGRRHGGLR